MPLSGFDRRKGELYCEGASLRAIAEKAGTPTYVYSGTAIRDNYRSYDRALSSLPHEIHYAVKANSSLGVLALLAREGAGFDIVSGGELFRVLQAGGAPERVVFSGVGKTRQEMAYALEQGIGWFNCESEAELRLLADLATAAGSAPSVALRVNPNVDAETHPYIATGLSAHKFGIDIADAERIYQRADEFEPLRLEGVSCHIGSQIFNTQAFFDALDIVLALVDRLRQAGGNISQLDLGGGLGIAYRPTEETPAIAGYASRLAAALTGKDLKLTLEPGRSIVGQAGVLLMSVLYRKPTATKTFVVVDAAMNDLIRPALYQAHHEIIPVVDRARPNVRADVVGPICESGDFLAKDRDLPDVEPGELLAAATAGAYGSVLSSNYNSRTRAAEVLVEGDHWRVIRDRESLDDLIRGERV
jgi:diaminopimelate decarboxylase